MRRLTLLLFIFMLAGCTLQVPRKYLPYPVTNDSFDDPVKAVAIPLPVIASSPNEGITSGALVAFLLHNAKDEVSSLVVPQMNYNQHFGLTSTLYGAFYLTPEESFKINLSKATKVNEEFRFRYEDKTFLSDRYQLNLNVFDYADGSARFFGFQSDSSKQNETNYTDHEFGFVISGGFRFADNFRVVLGERFKKVNISTGAVSGVPFITQVFPADTVPGVDGYTVHSQKLALVRSTLDSDSLPTSGTYLACSIENSAKELGSSASFQTFELEAKAYLPARENRLITVARFAYHQTSGTQVPFLEQSILGGETTLRGYGQNRFIDMTYLLLNLEERIRLFRWEIFNVVEDWELAPFIDLGSVMRSISDAKPSSFEFNPGVGLRAVVRPNIVGRIDVGVGREGPAVFVGLAYPF